MAIIDPKNQQNQGIRQPNQPQQQKRGTGFTNINRVLGANQNNRLGQTISQGVLGQTEQARGNIRQSNEKFAEQAGAGRLDTEANRVARQNTLNKVTQSTDAPPVLGEDETKQFENFRTGKYTGPQSLGNEAEIRSQAENAQSLGKMTQTAGGREGLLQRFAGGGGYGVGQQKVDQLLLSGAPGGLNAIRRYTQGLGDEQERAISGARNIGQEYANRAQAFNQETGEATKAAYDPINAQIEAKLAAAQAQENQRSKQYSDIKDLLDPSRRSSLESLKGLSDQQAQEQAINKLKEQGLLKDSDIDKIAHNTTATKLDSGHGMTNDLYEILNAQNIKNSGLGFWQDFNNDNRAVDPLRDYDFYKTSQGDSIMTRKGQDIQTELNKRNSVNSQALLNSLNSQDAANLNKQNLTGSIDAARLNALNKLSGSKNSDVVAGTDYKAGNTSFDLQKYLDSIQKPGTLSNVTRLQKGSSTFQN